MNWTIITVIQADKGTLRDPEDSVAGLDSGLLSPVPDMWTLHYCGLYSQYAIVGLLYGMSGTMVPLCSYVYNGDGNTCANARSVAFFAWNFKLLFALGTDCSRPFGMRRKPFMLFGMASVILILLFMTAFAHKMTVSSWLATLLLLNFFLMFSDVPADGYSVELGHLEPPLRRGQILATGQRVRFTFCMISGFIQTFLLNGPTTNSPVCCCLLVYLFTYVPCLLTNLFISDTRTAR